METIQIDYDPVRVSYGDLLRLFLSGHNPAWPSPSRQYASAIFYHDGEQERLAKAALKEASHQLGRPLSTELIPYEGFTRAEDYHQKYYLRSTRDIMKQLEGRFLTEDAFTDSTVAARINGYLGGHGTTEQLEREAPSLGLSGKAISALREILRKRGK